MRTGTTTNKAETANARKVFALPILMRQPQIGVSRNRTFKCPNHLHPNRLGTKLIPNQGLGCIALDAPLLRIGQQLHASGYVLIRSRAKVNHISAVGRYPAA
jgi:hypothetical protein